MNKLINFLKGRYLVYDELNKLIVIIYVILLIIDIFINNIYLSIGELLLVFLVLFRLLSKKIYKRSNENRKYLKFRNKLFKKNKDKNHVYKKCHKCKTVLKLPLPRKIGIKHVVCPECKKRNTFLVLRKLKIEIIRKK